MALGITQWKYRKNCLTIYKHRETRCCPKIFMKNFNRVVTPLWGKCEVTTHTPENGTRESSGTPKNSELDCKGQNTLPWYILDTVGKVSKCRCPKWPRMSHLDICNTSYGWKKGRESNCQCVQVKCNTPWKVLEESYKFSLDLVPIGGWGEKLWTPEVPGVQTGTISGLQFGSPEKKCHSDVGVTE
jgi:hypothetical protein